VSDFQSRLQSAIGHEFQLERELGGGGMSRVFVATERALQRRVVVKVLPPDLAAGVNVERFRREIQLAAGLQHPHIVPLLTAGDNGGLLWFTMPFIEGESLRAALATRGRLPARDVVRILHDVVDALAYAHARGVVHRDIKPDNILASGMHALVTDFGVAKALSAAIPLHGGGTTAGMAIGTPAYMAPEQLAADPAADHRVDLYAVGLLAYELLTGHSPFTSSSPQATLAAQLTKVPEPPHRSFTDVPEGLSAIIMACLEKDAAKRPQNAETLLAELDALPPMPHGSGRAIARRARRNRVPIIAGAVAVLLGSAVAFALFNGGDDRRAAARSSPDSLEARDAGPGGSRTPAMQVADAAKARTSTRPETVIVIYRDTSAYDGSRGLSVPLVISRAESLAIADAIERRSQGGGQSSAQQALSPQPNAGQPGGATSASGTAVASAGVARKAPAAPAVPAPGAAPGGAGPDARFVIAGANPHVEFMLDREQLITEVRRVFTDSMWKAMRNMDSALAQVPRFVRMEAPRAKSTTVVPLVGPNTDGRTRVVVSAFANATRKREHTGTARDLANFIRAALPSDRFEVIDAETTERAARNVPDRMAVGWALRSDYVVSGVLRERNDSLALQTLFTDVRGGHFSRSVETVAPMDESRRVFDAALGHVQAWLDSAKTRALRGPPRPERRSGVPGERLR
jgi:TolB-like protein